MLANRYKFGSTHFWRLLKGTSGSLWMSFPLCSSTEHIYCRHLAVVWHFTQIYCLFLLSLSLFLHFLFSSLVLSAFLCIFQEVNGIIDLLTQPLFQALLSPHFLLMSLLLCIKEGQSQGRWWWKLAKKECWDTVGIPKPSVWVATGW